VHQQHHAYVFCLITDGDEDLEDAIQDDDDDGGAQTMPAQQQSQLQQQQQQQQQQLQRPMVPILRRRVTAGEHPIDVLHDACVRAPL